MYLVWPKLLRLVISNGTKNGDFVGDLLVFRSINTENVVGDVTTDCYKFDVSLKENQLT